MNNVTALKRRRQPKAETPVAAAGVPAKSRTPWSGDIRGDEADRPGGLLLAALMRCADERGQAYTDMATELGVTYGYISQLRSGLREVRNISPEFSKACAHYLGVPRLTVLFMSGALSHKDAYEDEEMLAAEIPRAMAFIRDSIEWGTMVTPQVMGLDMESQFLVVRLFEEATGNKLLPTRLDAKHLSQAVKQFEDVQSRRRQDMAAHAASKNKATTEDAKGA